MLEFVSCLLVAFLACVGLICLIKSIFSILFSQKEEPLYILIPADKSCNDLDLKIYEAKLKRELAGTDFKIAVADLGMNEEMALIAGREEKEGAIIIIRQLDELQKYC